jgi:anti-sigma factor RsiW
MSEELCKQFSEKLSGLLDGELSVREAEGVKKHLESCEHCRAEYREMEQLKKVLKTSAPPAPSGEKWSSAWKNIEGGIAARRPGRAFRWAAAAFAAAAVIVVCAALFLSSPGAGPGMAAAEQPDMEIYEVGDGYRAFITGSADGPNTIEIICSTGGGS